MQDPHQILGVSEDIDDHTLKKRYKRLCKMFHPDKMDNDQTAVVFFTMIQNSYENIKRSRVRIEIPLLDSPPKNKKPSTQKDTSEDSIEKKPKEDIVIEGTNITNNDIRILGEKLQDPWFHPSFNLTEMFGDVNIPKKKKK